MEPKSLQLIKELSELSGPSSYEDRVREYMKTELAKYSDEIIHDRLGSTIGVKYSKDENAPKVMLLAHMDEIGFMVTNIEEDGLMQIKPLGGWWAPTMLSQRVIIHASHGDISGVITTRVNRQTLSKDQTASMIGIDKMRIDCGASSKSEASSFGIMPGTYCTPSGDFQELAGGKRVLGKAFDDRAGCAAVLELMEAIANEELACTVYAGGSVEEEGGVKSATAASNMVKPDIFIAVDCSHARDIGGKGELSRLGDGFLLRFLDGKMRPNRRLRDFMIGVAEDAGIKYQLFNSYGGTDAAVVQNTNCGVITGVIGIPVRYNHSHSVVMEKSDYIAARDMLLELVRRIDRDSFSSIIEY